MREKTKLFRKEEIKTTVYVFWLGIIALADPDNFLDPKQTGLVIALNKWERAYCQPSKGSAKSVRSHFPGEENKDVLGKLK